MRATSSYEHGHCPGKKSPEQPGSLDVSRDNKAWESLLRPPLSCWDMASQTKCCTEAGELFTCLLYTLFSQHPTTSPATLTQLPAYRSTTEKPQHGSPHKAGQKMKGWERGRASQSFCDLPSAAQSQQCIGATPHSDSLPPSTMGTASDASFLCISPVLPTLIWKHSRRRWIHAQGLSSCMCCAQVQGCSSRCWGNTGRCRLVQWSA